MDNKVDTQYVKNYFKDKSVLILGSGPSVTSVTMKQMTHYDIIVRVNNYHFFNDNRRVNVFYSFLGNSIHKKASDLLNDNVQLVMCKCPNEDVKVYHGDDSLCQLLSLDTRYIYHFREKSKYFIKPYYIVPTAEYNANNKMIEKIMSSGTAAILDILRLKPTKIHIAGFDWFASGIHYKGGTNIKPWPNCHAWKAEFELIKQLVKTIPALTAQDDIMELFEKPFTAFNH